MQCRGTALVSRKVRGNGHMMMVEEQSRCSANHPEMDRHACSKFRHPDVLTFRVEAAR
jgi:hypothetical protein